MHGSTEVLNVVRESTNVAAYLAVAGCPGQEPGHPWSAGEESLPGWGVALAGPIVVDPDGIIHSQSCGTARVLRLVRAEDLLQVPVRHCVGNQCVSPLLVAGSATFTAAVRTLAEDLDRPVAYSPPLDPDALDAHRELRDIRYTTAALEELRRFTTATVMPPDLQGGIEALSSWLTATGDAARRSLLQDGLSRLLKHLRAEQGATTAMADVGLLRRRDIRVYQKTLLPAAELALPGTQDSYLACMFSKTTLTTDTAIAAAPFAAHAVEPDFGRSRTHAVAVLPRELVVHLYAESAWAAPDWPPVAFAEVVDPATPGLRQICITAARLWAESDTIPGLAWQAAMAAAL